MTFSLQLKQSLLPIHNRADPHIQFLANWGGKIVHALNQFDMCLYSLTLNWKSKQEKNPKQQMNKITWKSYVLTSNCTLISLHLTEESCWWAVRPNLIHICNICSKENIYLSEVVRNQILSVEDFWKFSFLLSTKLKDSTSKIFMEKIMCLPVDNCIL